MRVSCRRDCNSRHGRGLRTTAVNFRALRLQLQRPDDFDLEAVVTSHGWYRLAPFSWNEQKGVLSHRDSYAGTVALLMIRQTPARIIVESSVPIDATLLESRVRRMLQIGVDLGEFHAKCAGSSEWSAIPARRLGRLLCAPTIFEDAVKIILTTNTRWKRTVDMAQRLVDHFGPGSVGAHAFPGPSDLADRSEEEINDLVRAGYRTRSIHQLATRIVNREIDLESRPDPLNSSYEDLYAWYLQFPGIGPYGAAHMTAMDGRHDRIAVDTEFRAWVRARYHGGRPVKDETLLRHYRRWGRWQYIAYWCEMHLG